MRENHIRTPVGLYALDHQDSPDVVAPSSDPRAVKARDLGRHVGRRCLHRSIHSGIFDPNKLTFKDLTIVIVRWLVR